MHMHARFKPSRRRGGGLCFAALPLSERVVLSYIAYLGLSRPMQFGSLEGCAYAVTRHKHRPYPCQDISIARVYPD